MHDIINHVFSEKNIAPDHEIQFYDPENPVITLFHTVDYQNNLDMLFQSGSDVLGV